MSTIRQKRLAKAYIENINAENPLPTREIVVAAGYSPTSADKMSKVLLGGDGVREVLDSLGFNEDTAKRVVSEILVSTDERANDRLKAAEMVFKVQGSFAPEKHVSVNVDVQAPEIKELTDKLNELYRGTSSTGDGGTASVVGTEVQD